MIESKVNVALLGRLGVEFKRSHQEVDKVSLGIMQLHLTLIELTHIQQLVYQRQDSGGTLVHLTQVGLHIGRDGAVLHHILKRRNHHRHRSANLMRHIDE